MIIDWLTQLRILADVAGAMVLGGLVGFERQLANRPAGFRTHTLVAGAAALAVAVGIAMVPPSDIGAVTRVLQGLVTGIGFLGAGTIFRHTGTDHVEGLTTAASVLMVTCMGMAAGAHLYIVATGATLLTLFALRGLRLIENYTGLPRNKS